MSGHAHTPAVAEHADAWHHHTKSEGVPQQEHAGVINTRMLAAWGISIGLAVVVVVIVLILYFGKVATRMKAERIETPAMAHNYTVYRASENALLGMDGQPGVYKALDSTRGTVQIPVDAAMQKVVRRYSEGQ